MEEYHSQDAKVNEDLDRTMKIEQIWNLFVFYFMLF